MAISVSITHDCLGTNNESRIFVVCDSATSQIFTIQLLEDGVTVSSTVTSPGANTHFAANFYSTKNGTHTIKVWGSVDPETSTTYSPSNIVTLDCTVPVSCDIAYSAATIVHDRNSAGLGQISANATSSATLEYSLDSLDPANFQTSNVFTGVFAGTHTIYYRDSNGCTSTQYNVVVNNQSCDISISSVSVTHETNEDLNDGSATITASSSAGGLQYRKETSEGFGAWQASNVFSGLAPGSYTVTVKDAANCEDSITFTVNEFKPAYLNISRANSLRFIAKETVNGCTTFQTFDNTLFHDMVFPGHGRCCYYQKVQHCDGPMKIQWWSNYTTNYIEVTNQRTGAVTTYAASAPSLPVDYETPLEYTILEASIDWGSLPSGYYDLKIKGSHVVYGSYTLYGEPVHLKTEHLHTNVITYANSESNFDIEYLTGIEHKIRIPSRFFQATNPGRRTIMDDNVGKTIKLHARLKRKIKLETFCLPFYLHEKLATAFEHDYITVNGEEFQSEENYDYKYMSLYSLVNGEVELTQVNFNISNTHDTGDINSISSELLELENNDYLEL